ncbi:glycoside hydrolase family 18 protein [Xylogone sp. PMI_703]|nr:glycoside hydrolase family 18 protein [Xylogone sp. PMI_703]
MQAWNNATCVGGSDSTTSANLQISELAPTKPVTKISKREYSLVQRDTCSYIQVVSGDSCGSLASKCGISASQFTTFNPSSTLCSTLAVGEYVCCSAGSLPDFTPKPNPDGSCAVYNVQSGDYCALIAANNQITVDNIESFNAQTWGWQGCSNIQLGQIICLSTGTPPMPAPLSNAICGPQVPGTTKPSDWSQIANLNPCPLNSCCDIWGQCGITPDFCTISQSQTGAPGTSAPGTAGCISNCGTEVTNNVSPPSQSIKVGYFESWNTDRTCLTMDVDQIPPGYTHIHFAFAAITSDFNVDLSAVTDQFTKFAGAKNYKRILSFGGWSFSTDQDSFPIFREGVTAAERQTFANNVVSVINQYNLDGVDFDWEYPGAPDIPGIPPGSPSDGPNYLAFLQTLRSIIPSGKTISMAAPASYWYLKGFPIKDMAPVLDYIVYMTYDLHGQWDYGNTFSNPGCANGNCLRSHVNLTETEYALAMITKAGVPANKVTVGVSSYGRSFGMTDPSCTGPECLFNGPDSTATPGQCTVTAGYVGDAEIYQYIQQGAQTYHDDESDSDIAVYNGNWVAYMNPQTKSERASLYSSLNFAGTVDWALDLETFLQPIATSNVTDDIDSFNQALSLSNFQFEPFTGTLGKRDLNERQTQSIFNVSDLATRLIGWEGCSKIQKNQIYSGWQQSWKIMNYNFNDIDLNGINFNEASAVEYLTPPAYNKNFQDNFKNMFLQLATIQPGWIPTPFDWRLHVRCDDPAGKCPCGVPSSTFAYTINNDPTYNIARINFCPKYFSAATLDQKMANADTNQPITTWANLNNYIRSQADIWIHELFHIDWVSNAGQYGPNAHVKDIKMLVQLDNGNIQQLTAYTPGPVKSLARYDFEPTTWVIKNADSLNLYLLARYVQNKLGNIYPHLPLAPKPPIDVPIQFVASDNLFTVNKGGSATITNTDEANDILYTPGGSCAAPDDEDGDADADATLTWGASLGSPRSALPDDYLSSLSSWWGLTATTTTTTTTTTTAAPTPTNWGAICGGPFDSNHQPNCNDNCNAKVDGELCPEFCCAVCPVVVGIAC